MGTSLSSGNFSPSNPNPTRLRICNGAVLEAGENKAIATSVKMANPMYIHSRESNSRKEEVDRGIG
ncbi:MAG: hypothetical protein HC894_10355 [Microcoleus sp. SM1_3_4]|nr:hypothetical protein [Microcoleus sp. SM1_3_4]